MDDNNKYVEGQCEVTIGVDTPNGFELGLKNLEICFFCANTVKAKYIAVITEGLFDKPDIIISHTEDFKRKLEFYSKCYNDNLVNKFSPDLKITGFTHGNSFEEIERDLLG